MLPFWELNAAHKDFFGTPYLLLEAFNLLIHLIFTWFTWLSQHQFSNIDGTFLETFGSKEFNAAVQNHSGTLYLLTFEFLPYLPDFKNDSLPTCMVPFGKPLSQRSSMQHLKITLEPSFVAPLNSLIPLVFTWSPDFHKVSLPTCLVPVWKPLGQRSSITDQKMTLKPLFPLGCVVQFFSSSLQW